MVIYRSRKDGTIGISIPCVLCRRQIDKFQIRWVAHDGKKWVYSDKTDTPIPVSRPTSKQIRTLGFRFHDETESSS